MGANHIFHRNKHKACIFSGSSILTNIHANLFDKVWKLKQSFFPGVKIIQGDVTRLPV